jgi:beta-glucanase (GH16 family)
MNETQFTNIKNAIRGNNPFQEKFYMVMNAALGQDKETIPDSTLPSQYQIDYVRVYQK